MTVSMEALADFLRVRIAEDEAQASGVERHESMGRGLRGLWVTDLDGERTMILCADPARVLAECEAKRRIVEDGLRATGDWAPGSPMVGYRAAMMSAHGMSAEVIERDGGGIATTWLVTCKCKSKWVGPTYEATEDKWRQHVHGLTGTAPKAMGGKAGRWMPDDPDAQEWRRLHAGF